MYDRDWLTWAVAAVAAIIGSVWASAGGVTQALLMLMCLDILAGLLLAGANGRLTSTQCTMGVLRKFFALLVVGGVLIMQRPILDLLPGSVTLPFAPSTALAFWLAIGELISLAEHAVSAGVPLPPWLIRWLHQAQHAVEGGSGPPEPPLPPTQSAI